MANHLTFVHLPAQTPVGGRRRGKETELGGIETAYQESEGKRRRRGTCISRRNSKTAFRGSIVAGTNDANIQEK